MADTMAMLLNSSNAVASGASAAAAGAAARYRGTQAANYSSGPTSNTNAFNTASYMNNLRAPVSSSRAPPNRDRDVGLHIHYQGHCPHGAAHGPPYTDDDLPRHSSGSYPSFRDTLAPERPLSAGYSAGYPSPPCGCSNCYWRDFLSHDVDKYETTRSQLRETYLWNLRELVRRHRSAPAKSREEKDGELEKLYWYYVGRVREIYENHCRHHRLLFRDDFLAWETPGKATLAEQSVASLSASLSRPALTPYSRQSSGGGGGGGGGSGGLAMRIRSSSSSTVPTPLSRTDSTSQPNPEPRQASKGKEKEVIIPGTDLDGVSTPVGVVDGNDKGEGSKDAEESRTSTSGSDETITKSQPTPGKVSMQQRFRHLWPNKARARSSLPVGENEKPAGNRKRDDERKSVA